MPAIRYARHLKNELAMLEAVMGVAPLMRYAVQDEIPPIIVAPSIEQYLRQNAFFRLLWKELPEGYGAGADPERMADVVREGECSRPFSGCSRRYGVILK